MSIRQRVACYVTRPTARGLELLVFEHVDDDPARPSGIQVPAGGLRSDESVEAGGRREIAEEAGLSNLTFVRVLGLVDDATASTTFVHFMAAPGRPAAFRHAVGGDGEDAAMEFACRWEPMPLAFELAGGQGAFVAALGCA